MGGGKEMSKCRKKLRGIYIRIGRRTTGLAISKVAARVFRNGQ